MNTSDNTFTLASGDKIPSIGFGPGIYIPKLRHVKSPNSLIGLATRIVNKFNYNRQQRNFIQAIANAIANGFRLIDYSETYGGYQYIREGIRESGITRDNLFITTRVGNSQQFQGIQKVRESFLKGLEIMGLEQFDLLQFHWPVTDRYLDTWEEILRLQQDGFVKNVGVANCNIHHLESINQRFGIWPAINQVEIHPLFTQKQLIDYCHEKNIIPEAYTPVARYDDRLVRLPLLKELEKKYGKSFIQIILRWHIQNGVIPVVRAMNPKHQKDNLDIFDFQISDEDMRRVDAININSRLRYDPDNCDFTIL